MGGHRDSGEWSETTMPNREAFWTLFILNHLDTSRNDLTSFRMFSSVMGKVILRVERGWAVNLGEGRSKAGPCKLPREH